MAVVISERGKLVKQDLAKVGKGALIAGAGAILFYLFDALPQINFGNQWTPIIVAFLSILGNLFRKWWTTNRY